MFGLYHKIASIGALLMLLLGALPGVAAAQAPARQCFTQTNQCIEGRFLEYWRANGGLPVFGYPVTAARNEVNRDTGKTHLTQWFERNRFELHPEAAAPYDVLLGRLGDDRLRQLGLDWRTDFPSGLPEDGCRYFDQTRHDICDTLYSAGQCFGGCPIGFKRYWETHGLELDGRPGKSYAESLALFGQPLTAAYIEPDATGSRQVVQWFERARFEWHPKNPAEFTVLLGLLGYEVRGSSRAASSAINVAPAQAIDFK